MNCTDFFTCWNIPRQLPPEKVGYVCFWIWILGGGGGVGVAAHDPDFFSSKLNVISIFCRTDDPGTEISKCPRLSICVSVTFRVRTVTRRRIAVFLRTCTISRGVLYSFFYIDGMLFEFCMNFWNIETAPSLLWFHHILYSSRQWQLQYRHRSFILIFIRRSPRAQKWPIRSYMYFSRFRTITWERFDILTSAQ